MNAQTTGGGRWARIAARGRRPAAGAVVAVVAFLLLRAVGAVRETDTALQVMGFDADRAELLTSLTVEALVVALGVLASRSALAASLAGMVVGAAIFARTFADETGQAAAIPAGAGTAFDPVGWLLTILTLLAAAAVVAWAAATIGLHVRAAGLAAIADARAWRRRPGDRRRLVRPAGAAVAIAVLAVALPVFGDMVNYAPDVRMRVGGPSDPGLTAADPGSAASAGAASASGAVSQPTILGGGAGTGATGSSPAVLATSRPWQGWVPGGRGSVSTMAFPAPWTGGSATQLRIAIYLPPGYASSTHRDPVIYEAPFDLGSGWSKSVAITSILDELIDAGRMPPTIAVFIPEKGGPFADAECANSADGREWMDRFIVSTVVPWVDREFRTIPSPAARAVMGFSQGGFCAAELALRHPDLFANAIAFSGYYQAGIRTGQTAEAAVVYGSDPAARTSSSPDILVGRLPSGVAHTLFFELNAKPSEPFYGSQYVEFSSLLHAAGVPVALFPSASGHAWDTVRDESPIVLATLAERWAADVAFT